MASVSARGISSAVARRAMHSTNAARQLTTAAATVAGNTMISLEKIDARVFCLGTEGGNPVTIFASTKPLSGSIQQNLAKTCDWESVVVSTSTEAALSSSSSPQLPFPTPTMAFFMPSGEEVSFCAHAAIGGAIAMGGGGSRSSWEFQASMTGDTFTVDTAGIGDEGNSNENNRKDENNGHDDGSSSSKSCCLHMKNVRFDEAPLSQAAMTTLDEWSDRLAWSTMSTTSPANGAAAAPPRNASVARPKTLVELESVDALQRAEIPPSDGSFANACSAMDHSTGVYLYAPRKINKDEDGQRLLSSYEYECRQFPRSSGYPEDPATGIAAAALAASLQFGGIGNQQGNNQDAVASYEIYQGTAMGRPSLIQVVDLQKDDENGALSFGLQGRVEIDATSTIQVSE